MSFSLCNERMVMLKYYCEDAESVLREVGSSEEGLSSGEAAKTTSAARASSLSHWSGRWDQSRPQS